MTMPQSDDKYADYLTRAQLVTATGYELAQLRGLYDVPGADAYFGVVRHKGQFLYPPASVEQFKNLLSTGVKKQAFTGILARLSNPTQSNSTATDLTTTGDLLKSDFVTLSPQPLSVSLNEITALMVDALATRVAPAPDRMLLADEVRAKLAGPIPKKLRPLLHGPARWSENDVHEYIAKLRLNHKATK